MLFRSVVDMNHDFKQKLVWKIAKCAVGRKALEGSHVGAVSDSLLEEMVGIGNR